MNIYYRMGVDLIVNDKYENNVITAFDESLNSINYPITDFRIYGMKWYFYDWIHEFKCKSFDKVFPDEIMYNVCSILKTVGSELGIELPANPIEARSHLSDILESDLSKLYTIIDNLQHYYHTCDIESFIKYITNLKLDCSTEERYNYLTLLSKKIRENMKFIELAIFLYTVSKKGHTIKWSF